MGKRIQGVTRLTDTPFDRADLNTVDRLACCDAAQEALFNLQDLRPHVALMGCAVLFATLCERLSMAPDEVHAMASRMIRPQEHETRANDSLQALRDFARIRMKGEETTIC